MRRVIIYSFIFGIMVSILIACANMSASLMGGPKDITPPKLAYSIPVINSTNYTGRKVEITFDEFLKVTDISKELVISPPLKHKPSIIERNKSIYIIPDDKDTFKANTTYTFYFGNSVQDLNEGNIFKHFEFVFSTGNVIDSLSFRGRVLNSFNLKADKDGYYVMLYDKFEDSIPRKHLPNYVTKTDEDGYFNLTHLHTGKYMILALKDANQNMLFDLPNEMIGFSDSLINLNDQYYVPRDSVILKDTAKFDSIRKVMPYLKPQIGLFTFEEDHKKQYVSHFERPQPYKFNIKLNRTPYDSVYITLLNYNAKIWFLKDINELTDSVSYWITDTALVHKDTLKTIITYSKMDSIGKLFSFSDTIKLTYNKKNINKQNKKGTPKKKANEFKISSLADKKDGFDLNERLFITASFPVFSIDSSKIHLFKIGESKDVQNIPIKFSIENDSVNLRNYWINFKFEPNTGYLLISDSAAFLSIYNQISDSTGIRIKTQKDDYYGTLTLNMINVNQHTIIQIIGNNEAVIKEKYIDSDGKVLFDFLGPGKYKIKVIYDRNGNNKWDTGNFGKRIQPEKVDYYDKIINIRSNWDNNETWTLK